jgi:hypothetical protein
MKRKARPSARTMRIALTESRVPVVRVGAPVPRSGSPAAGPVTGRSVSCTSVEVERRVAQGRVAEPPARQLANPWNARWVAFLVGLGFVAVALSLYTVPQPQRYYNHFVWQAAAFLDGRAEIDYPVLASSDSLGNALFQDVLPVRDSHGAATGRGLIPFPPLPAVFLMPFVAIWGLRTDEHLVGAALAALDVAIAWWALGRLPIRFGTRVLATAFFAFGTVFWYTAQLGTTWYFAHIVAVGLTLVAVGVAMRSDPESAIDEDDLPDEEGDEDSDNPAERESWRERLAIEPRQLFSGLMLGLASTARLSVIFGAPFLMLVGSGGSWWRRSWSAGIGAALPVVGLLAYNLATTGQVVHPAYEHLYRAEAVGYPELGYHPDWQIEDPRYIPQNLAIAVFGLPVLFPDVEPRALGGAPLCTGPGATRGLLDASCPIALPRDTGMSFLLSSPAYLLVIPALRRLYGRSRLVTGAALAVVLIGLFNLMHFSQGWVQIGYRFANDFVPFALPVVALGIERVRGWLVAALILASIAVSFWGVSLQHLLGW